MRDVIIDRSGQLGLRRLTHNLLANCRGILHEIGLMLVLTDLLVWRRRCYCCTITIKLVYSLLE